MRLPILGKLRREQTAQGEFGHHGENQERRRDRREGQSLHSRHRSERSERPESRREERRSDRAGLKAALPLRNRARLRRLLRDFGEARSHVPGSPQRLREGKPQSAGRWGPRRILTDPAGGNRRLGWIAVFLRSRVLHRLCLETAPQSAPGSRVRRRPSRIAAQSKRRTEPPTSGFGAEVDPVEADPVSFVRVHRAGNGRFRTTEKQLGYSGSFTRSGHGEVPARAIARRQREDRSTSTHQLPRPEGAPPFLDPYRRRLSRPIPVQQAWFSCFAPTLFLGSFSAAYEVPPSAMKSVSGACNFPFEKKRCRSTRQLLEQVK